MIVIPVVAGSTPVTHPTLTALVRSRPRDPEALATPPSLDGHELPTLQVVPPGAGSADHASNHPPVAQPVGRGQRRYVVEPVSTRWWSTQ